MSDKPELSQELNKGLVLALGGFCEKKERFLFKCSKYFVAIKNGTWLCNCPHNEFATINELYGHTGNICKHICAIAICFSVNTFIEPPKNVLEYIGRFIDVNYIFDCQLPNSKVKIIINDDEMMIKLGRKKSGVLAIKNNGKWQMNNNAKNQYEDFANDLQS